MDLKKIGIFRGELFGYIVVDYISKCGILTNIYGTCQNRVCINIEFVSIMERKHGWESGDQEVMNEKNEKNEIIGKKELALKVIGKLKEEYPEAKCTLDYDKAWQLLVSVRLAAQCTDARVDQITPKLYEKFPSVEALAKAQPEEIEEIVRPCGLGKSKARDISACMRILHDKYGGSVPDTFEELLALPGVGRKSANLIMGDVFGKPAIVTDTHCIRLCNLIGLVDGIKDPAKVERALWKIVPPQEGNDLCHRFVLHGRAVCVARRPRCGECCLKEICRHAESQGLSRGESEQRQDIRPDR